MHNILILLVFILFTVVKADEPDYVYPKGHLTERSYSLDQQLFRLSGDEEVIFTQEFRSGFENWHVENWVSAAIKNHDASNGISTAIASESTYIPNQNSQLVSPPILLPNVESHNNQVLLKITDKFEIEDVYDRGEIRISTDDGIFWRTIRSVSGKKAIGSSIIDITVFSNQSIRLAFHFSSDASNQFTGWEIRDLEILLKSRDPLEVNITSLDHQNFPFIYMNVSVTSEGIGVDNLDVSNFNAWENDVLQTNNFEVIPPDQGGGSRVTDIVFLMDNSGSMDLEIVAVSENVISFVDNLTAAGIDYSLGLCRFGADENNGWPIIEENGILTTDGEYFKTQVWSRNVDDGGFEPGWDALYQSAGSFSFRPGSQKIFILVTDENVQEDDNGGNFSQADAIGILQSSSITTYGLFNLDPISIADYGTICDATNGEYYDVFSSFDDILTDISNLVGENYIVRYSSNDPLCGDERFVDVSVFDGANYAEASTSYLPCSGPSIERTAQTVALHDQPWAENTSFTFEVEIEDFQEPYVNSAKLYFKNTSNSSWHFAEMVNTSDNLWEGQIDGAFVSTPGLDYYFTATDGESSGSDPSVNPILNPYQLAILPNEAPLIEHDVPETYTISEAIFLEATVTDVTNEIVSVRINYREIGHLTYVGMDMGNISNNSYEFSIPAETANEEGVEYYITAEDDFSVSATSGTADEPNLIYPEYDLGFRPSPDGWSFANTRANMWPQTWWQQFDYSQSPPYPFAWFIYSSDRFPDWPLFESVFGTDYCYLNPPPGLVIYNPIAVLKWSILARDYNGSCFGFALSSFQAFNNVDTFLDEYPGVGNFDYLYDLGNSDERRLCINALFVHQMGSNHQAHIQSNKSNTPVQTLNELKDMMREDETDYQILTFFNQGSGGGGHAVNPYRISVEEDVDEIWVYDNNAPGISSRKILIDKVNNRWHYPSLPTWGGSEGLFLMEPSSEYLEQPSAPREIPTEDDWIAGSSESGTEIYFNKINTMSVVNEAGDTISWSDSLMTNTFTNAHQIIPITGDLHPPIGFQINETGLTISASDAADSVISLAIFTGSDAISYERRNVGSDEQDIISLTGSLKISNPDTIQKTCKFSKIVSANDNYRIIDISGYDLYSNEFVDLLELESNSFKLSNSGFIKDYNLLLRNVTPETDSIFMYDDIQLETNSNHFISPDWQSLSEVPIYIDLNNDGSIDDTLSLVNQFVGDTPSTNAKLSDSNVYIYPNPFNPNGQEGIIRYSLSKPGNVTIKVYDTSMRLVKTLLKDEFQDAEIEQSVPWDGKNGQGDTVANGVYFYLVESSAGEKAIGKAAVIK